MRADTYSRKQIIKFIFTTNKDPTENQSTSLSRLYLPYVPRVTDRTGCLLRIEKLFKSTKKISRYLRSPKDKIDPLQIAGDYRIPCACGNVYSYYYLRWSVDTRIPKANFRLEHAVKPTMAEHTLTKTDHHIKFDETQLLVTSKNHFARLYRETIKIYKVMYNFNRSEEAITISDTQLLLKGVHVALFTINIIFGLQPLPRSTKTSRQWREAGQHINTTWDQAYEYKNTRTR